MGKTQAPEHTPDEVTKIAQDVAAASVEVGVRIGRLLQQRPDLADPVLQIGRLLGEADRNIALALACMEDLLLRVQPAPPGMVLQPDKPFEA